MAVATGPVWFQLYVFKDRATSASLVKRAEVAGCKAIVFTVDVPLLGRRERDVRNQFKLPNDLSVKNLLPAGLQESMQWVARSKSILTVVSGAVPTCSKRSLAVRALSSSDALSFMGTGFRCRSRRQVCSGNGASGIRSGHGAFRLPNVELNYARSHSAIVR